ncbi:MAG: hypothetical protein ACYS5W_23545 [Planctomycetota bacterium]
MSPRVKPKPQGPKTLKGSIEARRTAAVLLEALAGLRSTQEASDELGIALPRYYVLETRALQAMIAALEPKTRGRQRSHESEVLHLQQEISLLKRELGRTQALYRSSQRTMGLSDVAKHKTGRKAGGKKTRRVRKLSRAERVLKTLQPKDAEVGNVVPSRNDLQGAAHDGTT